MLLEKERATCLTKHVLVLQRFLKRFHRERHLSRRLKAASKLQRWWRYVCDKRKRDHLKNAATRIQSFYRMRAVRRTYRGMLEALAIVQSILRVKISREKLRLLCSGEDGETLDVDMSTNASRI